jgi:urease accessory protein
MCDAACLSEPVRLQRAVGELRVGVKRYEDQTVLEDLRQAGCLKARFPRRVVSGWMDVVTLNTGGGVAAGDRLDVAVSAGAGARVTVSAQAAERFYRAMPQDAPSRVRTALMLAPGAALEWLPQETILFDHCALDRRLEIDMPADARFLGVETLVFGRAAMGETLRQARLRDLIQVRRDGNLLLHDAVRMDGPVDALLQRAAIGQGARALATLVYVALEAEALLDPVRKALGPAEAGVSAWNGMLVARILGPDSASVRRSVIAALDELRESRPLPRVWLC